MLAGSSCFPLRPQQRTLLNRCGMSVRCQMEKLRRTLIQDHRRPSCVRAPSTRPGSCLFDEDVFAGSISLYVVNRRGSQGTLNISVSIGCLGMCAEIIAEYQKCF